MANLVLAGDPPIATMPNEAARKAIYNCATDEQAVAEALRKRGQQPAARMGQPFALHPDTADSFGTLPADQSRTLPGQLHHAADAKADARACRL